MALAIRQQLDGRASAARLRATVRERAGERVDGGYRYLKLDRMAYYVHKDSYRATLKRHIAELKRDLDTAAPRAALDAAA